MNNPQRLIDLDTPTGNSGLDSNSVSQESLAISWSERLADMEFAVLSDLQSIKALQVDWDNLHERCTRRSIYNSFDFIFTSLLSFPHKEVTPLVITARMDSVLVAIFPFQINIEWWMYVSMRTIQYNSLEETDKPYPLISTDIGLVIWEFLWNFLNTSAIKFDRLSLIELRDDGEDIALLEKYSKKNNLIYRVNTDKKGPIIDLSLSWDEFWSAHPKMRKKVRKMEKDFSSGLHFSLIEDHALVFDVYSKLESLSWKKGKVGVTKNAESCGFYKTLFERLSLKNKLLLGVLYLDDNKHLIGDLSADSLADNKVTLVSAEIAYMQDDEVFFCHGCYNDNFKKYSPGMVSTSYFLKYFFTQDTYKRGDFLCGYAGYLDAWSQTVVETHCVDIYRTTFRVRFSFTLRILRKLIDLGLTYLKRLKRA